MPASIASAPWPALTSVPVRLWDAPWGRTEDASGIRWTLRRNCALSPRQLGRAYGLLCAISLLIATTFALNGAPVVLLFSLVEMAAVGAALLVFARHVRDGEVLTLRDRVLHVEQSYGGRTQVTAFRAEWLTVEPSVGKGSLVELSGEAQRVRVGRFVIPELRARLAQELRQALRLACHPSSDFSV